MMLNGFNVGISLLVHFSQYAQKECIVIDPWTTLRYNMYIANTICFQVIMKLLLMNII